MVPRSPSGRAGAAAALMLAALLLATPSAAAPNAPAPPQKGAPPTASRTDQEVVPPQASATEQKAARPAASATDGQAAKAEPPAARPLVQTGLDAAGRPRYEGTLSLSDAMGLGLRENLGIALGQAETRAASAETREAAAMGAPKLSIGATAAAGTTPMIWPAVPRVEPGFLTNLPDGAVSLNAGLMVPIFNGGLFRARLEAAEQSEKAAVARAALSLRETGRAVRTGWAMVQQAAAEQEVAVWELEQQRELLRLARRQLELGRVARVEVLRAEAEASSAEGRRELAVAGLAQAEAELKVAMGVSVQSSFDYAASPPETPLKGTEEEDLATALSDRPDLVAARYAVEARDRQVAEALADFSPQVYAMAMGERMQMDALRGGGMVEGGYQVGVGIAFPIFDGGERAARVDKARAELDAGRIELEQMEQEATAQVLTARARSQAAWKALELAEAEVASATEGLRIARLRREAGRGIQLEILDAVAALRRARGTLAEAEARVLRAQADLLYATGRY